MGALRWLFAIQLLSMGALEMSGPFWPLQLRALGDAPVYVNGADEEWVRRPDDVIRIFRGTLELAPGLELHTLGGHFPGSTAALWDAGAEGKGVLLAGDAGYGARLAIIIAVVLSVCLICMLCFISAHLIARTLGRTGNAVLSRVLGMLLAAYSVQFVINGIAAVRASLS